MITLANVAADPPQTNGSADFATPILIYCSFECLNDAADQRLPTPPLDNSEHLPVVVGKISTVCDRKIFYGIPLENQVDREPHH